MKTSKIAAAVAAALVAAPIVVAYGCGVDSTAMLVGMVERGIRPAAILFADVGAEKDETYAYLPIMNAYLVRNGFPQITVVRYVAQDFKHYPPYYTLEQNCLTNGTLPSEAFGFGSCSIKWKAAPQEKWIEAQAFARDAFARGRKVVRAVGYDAGGADCKRSYKASNTDRKAHLYSQWFPLQEWGWDRETCKAKIAAAGLPVPPKSSCFFCPNMSPAEVRELPAEKLRRIVFMEARAKPRLLKIEGLWRNGVKGRRDPSKKRPGRMTDFIRDEGLLPAAEVERIEAIAPIELADRAGAFKNGLRISTWDQVFTGLELKEVASA